MSPGKKKILIVCTGNTCRSPMTAALMREMLDSDEYDVKSAGLAAIFNMGASAPAIRLMKECLFYSRDSIESRVFNNPCTGPWQSDLDETSPSSKSSNDFFRVHNKRSTT